MKTQTQTQTQTQTLLVKCMKQIDSLKCNNLHTILPLDLYHSYIKYLNENHFPEWINKIKLVNLEINIQDIEVTQDMYLDNPTYHIYIKKKIDDKYEDEDEIESEFILFNEFEDESGLYDLYYKIAKNRYLLDLDEDLVE